MYQNLLIITLSVVELGNVADKMGRAKGAARYTTLIDLADEAIMLGKVDVHKAKEELQKLKDDAGLKESFMKEVKEKLDLVDDDLEVKVEHALSLGVKVYEVVSESISLAKSFKKK